MNWVPSCMSNEHSCLTVFFEDFIVRWTCGVGGNFVPVSPPPLNSNRPCMCMHRPLMHSSCSARKSLPRGVVKGATDSDVSLLTSVESQVVLKKTAIVHQTLRLCGQQVRVVYGDWQMFLPTGNCISRAMFLSQTARHRGWSPLPSLLPKLPNLMPHPQPRVQPNLLPRWQPSLQPRLQLESPFQWSLLSMCSSSKSNTPARKSGTQSLSLSRPDHASQQAVSCSFCGSYALMFACLVSCRASFA